jgi:hypothetical protein
MAGYAETVAWRLSVTNNGRRVSACSYDGRLVSCGAANDTKHHWMTYQCRPPSPRAGHDAGVLRTSRGGPDAIILRLPLPQRHHRLLADAANAQEEREEAQACDELSHALTQ